MTRNNINEPIPSSEMLINTVDSDDRVIGAIKRKDVLSSHKNFRVVHVFLFNEKNELLIQKISKKNKRHPFYWGSSVAGYLFAGEEYKDGAFRRIKQELGIMKLPDLSLIGKITMKEETGSKIISLFTCEYTYDINPDSNLIVKAEFYSLNNIRKMIDRKSRKFTPTFVKLFNFFEQTKNT